MYFLELKISKADSKFRASTNICDAQEKYYENSKYLSYCVMLWYNQSIYLQKHLKQALWNQLL